MTALSPSQTAAADQLHTALMESLHQHIGAVQRADSMPLLRHAHPVQNIDSFASALRRKHTPDGISRLCAAALIELARLTPGATP